MTPERANYSFSPSQRSFSQLGQRTEAAFTASFTGDNANPLDTPEYFVRQTYLDFLGREPDEGGFNYWSNPILGCGDDVACVRSRRISVAAAFFIEQEFQQSGSFICNMYAASLGRQPAFAEYAIDRQQVVGGADLESEKVQFAIGFVARPEFVERYRAMTTPEAFVDAMLDTVRQSGNVDLSGQRETLIARYTCAANQNLARAAVVRALAENNALRQANYNSAFMLTEYFGYLRRDPDTGGYQFWLNVLNNREPGNHRGMVCSFITSTEY